jgi:predicted HicB family RNase H-like nuclease
MMEVAEKERPGFEERLLRVREKLESRDHLYSDWVVFYREVLGLGGLLEKLFGTDHERERFEQTEEYAKIQQAVAELRVKNKQAKETYEESTRVITVRLPKSMHEVLRSEAHKHQTSMNQLCISKLLQVIDGELVPSDLESNDDNEGTPRKRPSRRNNAPVKKLDETPQAEPEPEPEVVVHSPLAVGSVPMSSMYSDSLGGRPF